jgi:uncharacterized SAM-binding protein YcdF (DUF218 family)
MFLGYSGPIMATGTRRGHSRLFGPSFSRRIPPRRLSLGVCFVSLAIVGFVVLRHTPILPTDGVGNRHIVGIVLGEKLLPDGQASANLHARINIGAEVARKHEIKDVIFSGGDTARLGNTETAVMKSLWDAIGNDSVTIYTDDQSLSTCQNAFYSLPMLRELHATQIYVVTSDFHVARTRILFEQVFQTVDPEFSVEITFFAAPTMANRSALFENERKWLQPAKLELLLTEMKDHPFLWPSSERIRQAAKELDEMKRGRLPV